MIKYLINGILNEFDSQEEANEYLASLSSEDTIELIQDDDNNEITAEDTILNPDFLQDAAVGADVVSGPQPAPDTGSALEDGSLDSPAVETFEIDGKEVTQQEFEDYSKQQEEKINFLNTKAYQNFDRPELELELENLKTIFVPTEEQKERIDILSGILDETVSDKLYKIHNMPEGKEKENKILTLSDKDKESLDAYSELTQDTRAYKVFEEASTQFGPITQAGRFLADVIRTEETPTEILNYNQKVMENVLYALEKDATTKGRLNYDTYTLDQKESLLKNARFDAFMQETRDNRNKAKKTIENFDLVQSELGDYINEASSQIQAILTQFPQGLPPDVYERALKIQDDAKAYEAEANKKLESFKKEFELLQSNQNTIAGAYGIDTADGSIKIEDSFEKSGKIKEYAEKMSDGLGGTQKGLGKALQGTWRMFLEGAVGFPALVMGKAGSLLTGGDYNVYDAFIDMTENNINYDLVGDTATTLFKDGEFSAKELLALGGDMTGYVAALMGQIKKGNISSLEKGVGKIMNTKRVGNKLAEADKDLIMIQETVKMLALDNYINALDSGLSKQDAFFKSSTETIATAGIQMIMPDYKLFKAGNYIDDISGAFSGSLKGQAVKKATINIGKNLAVNFLKETGEEELEFAFNRLNDAAFALQTSDLWSDDFWVEQKQLVTGTAMLSLGLGSASNYRLARNIYADVLTTNKQKITNAIIEVDIKIDAVNRAIENGAKLPDNILENLKLQKSYINRMEKVAEFAPSDVTGQEIALLVEKDKLTEDMKLKDPVFTKEAEARVDQINKQLEAGRVNKSFTRLVDQDIKNALKVTEGNEGVVIEAVANQAEANAVMDKLKDAGAISEDTQAGSGPGFIVTTNEGNADVIVLNKEAIYEEGVIKTGAHEVLHFGLKNLLAQSPGAANDLAEAVASFITSDELKLEATTGVYESRIKTYAKRRDKNIARIEDRLELGEIDFETSEALREKQQAIYSEEVIVLLSEAMASGDIKFKENKDFISNLKNIASNMLGSLPARFDTGKDVYDFIKGYNKSLRKGKLTKDQQRIFEEGAEGKLVPKKADSKESVDTDIRESMKNASPEMRELLMQQEEIFMLEGEIDANELQVREDKIAEKIAQLEKKEAAKKDVAKPKIKAKAVPKIMLTVQQAEQAYDDALDALNADFNNPALEAKVDKALEELEAAEARAEAGEEVVAETKVDKPKVVREKKDKSARRYSLETKVKDKIEPLVEKAQRLNKELRAKEKAALEAALAKVPTDESVMSRTKQSEAKAKIRSNPPRIQKSAGLIRLENRIAEELKTPIGKASTLFTKLFYDKIPDAAKEVISREDYKSSIQSDITTMLINEFKKRTVNRQGETVINDLEDIIFQRGGLRVRNLATRLGIADKSQGITKRGEALVNLEDANGNIDIDGQPVMDTEGKFKISSLLASDARYNQAVAAAVDFWRDNAGNSPIENFKKLPSFVDEIMADMFGVSLNVFTARSGNLNKESYRNALKAITKPYAVFKITENGKTTEQRRDLSEADAFEKLLKEDGVTFERIADQSMLQTFFKFLPKLSADDYRYADGTKGRYSGKATGIPKNLIKLTYDNITRGTTGIGNRKAEVGKKAYDEILKAIGGFVNAEGNVQQLMNVSGKTPEGQTLLGVMKLINRMISNELSRTSADLDPMTIKDIAAGKNDLMFSLKTEGLRLLDSDLYGQIQDRVDNFVSKNPKANLAQQIQFINKEAKDILGLAGLRIFNYEYRKGIDDADTIAEIESLVGKSWGKAYKYILKEESFAKAVEELDSNTTKDAAKLFVAAFSRAMRNQKYLDMSTNKALFNEMEKRIGKDRLKDLGFTLQEKDKKSFILLDGEKINSPLTILQLKNDAYNNTNVIGDRTFEDAQIAKQIVKDILTPSRDLEDVQRGLADIEAMSLGQLTPIRKLSVLRNAYDFEGKAVLEHVTSISNINDQLRKYVKKEISEKQLDEFFDTLRVDVIPESVDKLLAKVGGEERYNNPKVKKALKKLGKPSTFDIEAQIKQPEVFEKLDEEFKKSKKKFLDNEVKNSLKLDRQFNKFLEYKTGIPSFDEFGKVRGGLEGRLKRRFDFFIPPSAEDFVGLLYKTLPKGKQGEKMLAYYKKNLLDPYAKAMTGIEMARNKIGRDYKKLKEELKIIPSDLKKTFTYENEKGETVESFFTKEHAVRVYMWNKKGLDIPGLTEEDRLVLVNEVVDNAELRAFANELLTMNTGEDTKPKESWAGGTITTDLLNALNTTGRKDLLTVWQANVDAIFSEANLNKLEAAFGSNYRSALEDMLRRMATGRNTRPGMGNKETDAWTAWLTNSVGNIMFLNSRSALLQLISATNFLNFRENNIFAAGKAFANQPQYWKDFVMLWNSDFLVDRRDGLKLNVNEADLADIAKTQGVQGILAKLLKLGFTPTKFADSFAIASGGATYFRTKYNALIKDGVAPLEAKRLAMQEFTEIAQESQQSSRPDKISKEQAQPIGRIILAFANTPQQYARIMKKAALDLKNGRGSAKENIAKLAYYGLIQNLIFSFLQQGLFAMAFDDEEDEELSKNDKAINVANSMSNSLLRGLGLWGAIAATLKDVSIKMYERSEKKRPEYSKHFIKSAAGISPPLGSKIVKGMRAWDTYEWNKEFLFDLEGVAGDFAKLPGLRMIGDMTAAATGVPLDRALSKTSNLIDAMQQETRNIYRPFLAVGYPEWQLEQAAGDKKGKEAFEAEKERRKNIKKENKIKEERSALSGDELRRYDLKKLKKEEQVDILFNKYKLSKKQINRLTKEEDRINKIMSLEALNKSKKRKKSLK